MTARQPFTQLCQKLAKPAYRDRADLHVHTTCSDGAYAPAQVVDLARRSGLAALAITDHDTIEALPLAEKAAHGHLEIVPGVEITAQYAGREFHLLGYFFRRDDAALAEALARLRGQRRERFQEMLARLSVMGIHLQESAVLATRVPSRRHLAEMLVRGKHAGSLRDAFARYLGDHGRVAIPRVGLPVAEAIALVRGAGGVAAWAHPPYDCTREKVTELADWGLQAVEVDFPNCPRQRARALRVLIQECGLAVSGGSDCHGPEAKNHAVGSHGVSRLELEKLRALATG